MFWGAFISAVLLVSSCASRNKEYVKPDFTDEQVFAKEIERIGNEKKENPLYALWRSALLVRECRAGLETSQEKAFFFAQAESLFKDCALYTETAFSSSFDQKDWAQALLLGENLFTAYRAAGFSFENSEALSADCAVAKKAFEGLARLPSYEAGKTVNDFIQGCVTVWVDLGVRVEKGMGYVSRVIGSGFFIDDRGYIVTNHHVVESLVNPEYEGYAKLYIKLAYDSETRIPAKVIGWDKTLDLALIKTEIKPPYVFTLGSSKNLSVGDRIYAIGSPAGLESTITSGIVSSFDRNLLSTVFVMQIDAAVNSGNSGGPLVDDTGLVLGIVFAGMPDFQGLNFAVPVEYLQAVLNLLYSIGETQHSWIGAYGRTRKKNPCDADGQGVEILYVMPGSSADYAGLCAGDIITAVNGKRISSLEELQLNLIACRPRSLARVEYKRFPLSENPQPPLEEEATQSVQCRAEAHSEQTLVYFEMRPEFPGKSICERDLEYRIFYPVFGMELVPASVGNKRKFLVKSVVKGSPADESGFSVNDPVEVIRTKVIESEQVFYAEVYTKKRKSGYFDVNLALGAPLDSLYFF